MRDLYIRQSGASKMYKISSELAYEKQPIEVVDGIPIFSRNDDYVDNYKKIAFDHVQAIEPGAENPFMEDSLWIELEDSTRALITKHVPLGSRILDVGVGLGRLMAPLDGYERYGIDISLDYLKVAKDKGIDVSFSKIEDMPFKSGFFDAVVTCDVLEHVLDLNECCAEIIRVLKPGGILIVRVPNKEDLTPYLDDSLPYEYIHLRTFDEASLRLLFNKIHKMEFVEAATVAPYLQGMPRLKVQLLPASVMERIATYINARDTIAAKISRFLRSIKVIRRGGSPVEFLNKVTQISAEDFMNSIYFVRDNYPDEYNEIKHDLIIDMDVNAVFRK